MVLSVTIVSKCVVADCHDGIGDSNNTVVATQTRGAVQQCFYAVVGVVIQSFACKDVLNINFGETNKDIKWCCADDENVDEMEID